jgi:hypothetical protein
MPAEQSNHIRESSEKKVEPEDRKADDEPSRGNTGNEGFRSGRTDDDPRSLEELADNK